MYRESQPQISQPEITVASPKDRCASAVKPSDRYGSLRDGHTPSQITPLPNGMAWLLFLALLLLTMPRWAAAQQVMPDPAPLTNFNPLCDSSLVHCLEIDDFAGHVYGHLQVLPQTDHRDSAAVFPFGVSLGLGGRIAGGISTSYSFWKQDGTLYQQLGPLRLSLSGRLWPLFPLFGAAGDSAEGGDGSHYEPSHRLQLGLAFEQEVRVGPFSGANSLGLLTDLASLYLVGSKRLGPFQVSASLGALYDWHGSFATGSIAGQFGWFLPGFSQLKVFVEGMGRGVPGYVNPAAMLSGPDGQAAIRPQGIVAGGLAFRALERVDLGVEVMRGFGDGIAPWAVSVKFLVLSLGRKYQGRAATPIAQLAVDAATETAKAVKEYIASLPVDPKLDENCVILDKDDITVLGRFGKRTPDGVYCEQDGFRVPIGHEFERDPKATKLCRDTDLKDCFLQRQGKEWVPIHQPKLDGQCDMYDTDDTYLGRLGTPTADGERCRYPVNKPNGTYGQYTGYQEQPIGVPFHTDADRSRVCTDEAMKNCFMAPAEGRHTLAVEGIERYAKHADRRFSQNAQGVMDTAQSVENVATGKTSLTTVGEEIERAAMAAAKGVVDIAHNPGKIVDAAVNKKNQIVKAIEDFENASPERKLDTLGDLTGDGLATGINAAATAGAGQLLGIGVGAVREVADVEKALAKAGKKAARGVKAVERLEQKGVAAARATRTEESLAEHGVPAVKPTPKTESELPGRHGAFQAAKRDAGIPQSQHPDRVYREDMTKRSGQKVLGPDDKPIVTRNYEYTRPDGTKVVIQDHSAGHQYHEGGVGDQGSHFNVRPIDDTRNGTVNGTKGHYDFRRK